MAVSERVHARICPASWVAGFGRALHWLQLIFVGGFHTEELCFGVDFVNSSLLYVLMALLRQFARDRDPLSTSGERTQLLRPSQVRIPKQD